MKRQRIYGIQSIIDELKLNGLPFTFESTSLTTTIKTSEQKYYELQSATILNKFELQLIKKTQADASALDLDTFPTFTSADVAYINKANIKRGQTLKGEFIEIDLTQAYWNCALLNNIISENTYLYANNPKISKKARLIALGTLAKCTRTIEYDGQKYIGRPVEMEAPTAKLFYLCCKDVADFMQHLGREAGSDFIFYWVDAIFLKKGDASKYAEIYLKLLHADLIKENPIFNKKFYSIYNIQKIRRNKNKYVVYSQDHKNNVREFNFQKTKKPLYL